MLYVFIAGMAAGSSGAGIIFLGRMLRYRKQTVAANEALSRMEHYNEQLQEMLEKNMPANEDSVVTEDFGDSMHTAAYSRR